jgi:hypothetical protein
MLSRLWEQIEKRPSKKKWGKGKLAIYRQDLHSAAHSPNTLLCQLFSLFEPKFPHL